MQEMLDEPARGSDRPGRAGHAAHQPRHHLRSRQLRLRRRREAGDREPQPEDPIGRSVAVVVPSGSGKSTLLNLILRLYTPTEGRITIDGVDIRRVTRNSLRSSMAVVFQENMLFNMSLRENIRPRQGGGDRRGSGGGSTRGRDPQLHHDPSRGLRHHRRRARRHALRRSAPAHRHCARDRARSVRAAAGRGDFGARPDHRGGHQPDAAGSGRGADHHLLDPPPDVGGGNGRDHRRSRGPGGGAGLARPAARRRRRLCEALGGPAASARMRPRRRRWAMKTTRTMTRPRPVIYNLPG